MDEEWKPVFDGNYEISNHGRFRRAKAGRRTHAGKLLALTKLKIGYLIVQPVINGKNKSHYVHKLVAEQFLGPCPAGHEINHKDGNKANPHFSNLEYVTHLENMRHAHSRGLIKCHRTYSDRQVAKVRSLRNRGYSYSQIVKATGITIAYCWMIVNGKARKCSA
jgi:hypothetical protein